VKHSSQGSIKFAGGKGIALSMAAAFVAGLTPALQAQSAAAAPAINGFRRSGLAVGCLAPVLEDGGVRTGRITSDVVFSIDADVRELSMFVEVSGLYKAGDPTSREIPPIALDRSQGAVICPEQAVALQAGSEQVRFRSKGDVIEGFPTRRSETVSFRSTQDKGFHQDVIVRVHWDAGGAIRNAGQYAGVVKLSVFALPGMH